MEKDLTLLQNAIHPPPSSPPTNTTKVPVVLKKHMDNFFHGCDRHDIVQCLDCAKYPLHNNEFTKQEEKEEHSFEIIYQL
jgi:hypothetical protein